MSHDPEQGRGLPAGPRPGVNAGGPMAGPRGWAQRAARPPGPPVSWVVAGPPGAGKTTVAGLLLAALAPAPALLDKDTMYGSFVAAILSNFGRAPGEREGPWYDDHIKVHEYAGMTETAREIRSHGCPVLLCGPFTEQIRNLARWRSWVADLGGDPIRLIWVRSDGATLQARLGARGSARDTEKLAHFAAFTGRMQPGTPPAAPHDEIDNRLSAAASLEDQVATLLRRGSSQN
jgi:predicted kinase